MQIFESTMAQPGFPCIFVETVRKGVEGAGRHGLAKVYLRYPVSTTCQLTADEVSNRDWNMFIMMTIRSFIYDKGWMTEMKSDVTHEFGSFSFVYILA
jgi:hypothetical protein